MEFRTLGWLRTRVAAIGQGTWQFDRVNRRAAIRVLQRGFELGMTHVDTAELYGRGEVEQRIVAPALRGWRASVFLVSKVRPPFTSFRQTLRACERSLRRLGTDYLDLYLLHWKGPHPLAETLEAFDRLREQGKIRAYGVSNLLLDELQEAVHLAGPGRVACNQVAYSLENRLAELDMIPWCEANGVSVVAYSPLGTGHFPPHGSTRRIVLDALAASRGITPHRLALRFLLRHRSVLVIPKHSTIAHAEDNAAASEVRITDEEVRVLEAAFPVRRPDAPPTGPSRSYLRSAVARLAYRVRRGPRGRRSVGHGAIR